MRSSSRRLRDLTLFAMLGAVMHAAQFALQSVLGVQLIGLFIAAFTLTYRARALIPIYVWVALHGAFYGFIFMIPYLYIWLVPWGIFMLAGKLESKFPKKVLVPVYMMLSALGGLTFGTLYAPFWALWSGFTFRQMLLWIASGFPTDIGYAVSNFAFGLLIIPLSELLKKLNRQTQGRY